MEMDQGETLPLHLHPSEKQHSTVCIKGSILVHGIDGAWAKILYPADVFEFPPDEYHAIVALEPNTVFQQIFLTPSKIAVSQSDDLWKAGITTPHPRVILETYEPLQKLRSA